MVGRLSASVLEHAGCGAWIGPNAEAYVAIAKQLAAAGRRQPLQRQALREQIQASALSDGARLAGELERLYRDAAARALKVSSS